MINQTTCQNYFNWLNVLNKRLSTIPVLIIPRQTKSIMAWFYWEDKPTIYIYKNHLRSYKSLIQHEIVHYYQWRFCFPVEHDRKFRCLLKELKELYV